MAGKKFIYTKGGFPDPDMDPVNYHRDFFQMELDLESDVFHEIRKMNGIEPTDINESSVDDLIEIMEFFEQNKDTFFFLFHKNNDLIGSILFLKNYIQSLSISEKYQHQGYGEKLLKYCINKILDEGYLYVELDVLQGNVKAENLFRKLGFEEEG